MSAGTKWIELTLHGGRRMLVNLDHIIAVEDHVQGAIMVFVGKPSPVQVQQTYDVVTMMTELGSESGSNDKVPAADAAGKTGKLSGPKRESRR